MIGLASTVTTSGPFVGSAAAAMGMWGGTAPDPGVASAAAVAACAPFSTSVFRLAKPVS